MAANNEKKYGRTFFDLIAEHPKPTFFIFLAVLLFAVALIIFGIPFKVGSVEVGEKKSILHDTTVKTKTDTQYIEKSPISIKPIPTTTQTKNPAKKISVKMGDTIVTVQNQPANINTGTNNGIIGNNNEVRVNVNDKGRNLDDPFKEKLLEMIDHTFKENNKFNPCVKVYSVQGNPESLNLANQIQLFLQEKKLDVFNQVIQYQYSPSIKGVAIFFNFTPHIEIFNSEPKTNCVCIVVGNK